MHDIPWSDTDKVYGFGIGNGTNNELTVYGNFSRQSQMQKRAVRVAWKLDFRES